MAEDESDQESERLGEELEAITQEELQGIAADDIRSREYCRRFCEVVEEYTARWQVPLPQVQVLQTALCCFTSASVSLPAQCEHVQYVLSRLALSLFELLLFFGKDEFYEEPLKDILGSVQECHDLLFRYDSADLTLVTGVIKDGGPWEHPVLQAILKGKSEPEDVVDKYMRSENPVFFELRVRYLIACERIPEAMALITTCLSHPEVSKNLYYHQAYFTCLYMARLTDKLLSEHVRRIDCTDGVQIICNTESEGKTALAWQLSESFLLTQLRTGAMYCIWDLIFIWSKLQLKMNSSKQVFVEQCYHMLRVATNVKVIFPFMKIIKQEIAEAGIQLSVELCGCALQLDLQNELETKCLIYKTIAYLLPTDLEICRICALSVFFLERTPESYQDVERLYKRSDEDYNEFTSFVENRVRFELLPILKRGLLFDPEFWNLSTIQKNCANLLDDKAVMILSNFNKLDNIVYQNLNEDFSVTNLSNGPLEHKNASNIKSGIPAESKRNHTVVGANKLDHINVPRHHCTLCNKELLGGHIFRHAQAHQKKGCFSCVICARKFRNRLTMLKHLKDHIKKIQRQPMAKPADHAASNASTHLSDTLGVNFSDISEVSLEKGNSNNATNEVLTSVSIVNATNQDSDPEPVIPVENHVTDHVIENLNHVSDQVIENLNRVTDQVIENLNHVTDLKNSVEDVELCEIKQVECSLPSEPPECNKINGSLHPCSGDHVVNHGGNYKCPGQGCTRVFKKTSSLNKHARKAHPTDIHVQQHLMNWSKGKCRFCFRKFVDAQHYIDHVKRHIYPNVYFCQHMDCKKSFKLAGQLTEHMSSHVVFRAQCNFPNCSDVFEKLSYLYEHEALHYKQKVEFHVTELATQLPAIKSVDHVIEENIQEPVDTTNSLRVANSENVASVKDKEILDLLVPMWKSRKDVAKPKTYMQIEQKINDDVQNGDEHLQEIPDHAHMKGLDCPVPELSPENVAEIIPNGYNVSDQAVKQITPADSAHNVANSSTIFVSDAAQEATQKDSAVQPDESASKAFVNSGTVQYGGNRVFIRPLPPSYLDEQYISMPKRRKMEEEHTPTKDTTCNKPVERFRCEKCLTNYCSLKALDEHVAQKKCQSFFGFDSDDESAW
ncbi:zinc finger 654 [Pelobates cultripes]|uniref:Zinc finger 654 n=1 Tax=Pelobates cultripes TaxID=61616 RepID=A0AAD1QXR5_PELCU|nr:zinc finger 654 [Pelobates cultripes]